MEECADLIAYDKVLNISKHPIWMQWQRKRGKYQPDLKVLVGMEWVPANQHFTVETTTIEKALSCGELRAEADALRQEMIGMVKNSFGPSAVGYEKLRRSFDRQDRGRLRPFSEGAGDKLCKSPLSPLLPI